MSPRVDAASLRGTDCSPGLVTSPAPPASQTSFGATHLIAGLAMDGNQAASRLHLSFVALGLEFG